MLAVLDAPSVVTKVGHAIVVAQLLKELAHLIFRSIIFFDKTVECLKIYVFANFETQVPSA